jgi:hypothetical protein
MMAKRGQTNAELERRDFEFSQQHPALREKLGIRMNDATLLERQDPQAAAILIGSPSRVAPRRLPS